MQHDRLYPFLGASYPQTFTKHLIRMIHIAITHSGFFLCLQIDIFHRSEDFIVIAFRAAVSGYRLIGTGRISGYMGILDRYCKWRESINVKLFYLHFEVYIKERGLHKKIHDEPQIILIGFIFQDRGRWFLFPPYVLLTLLGTIPH